MSDEQRYFDTLRKIAKEYQSSEQIHKEAMARYGLSPEEAILMSYDNIRAEALFAIQGKSRPKL